MKLRKKEIIALLSQRKEILKQKYPLHRMALFGSFARGEEQPDSDIDIMVEFTEPVGMEIVDLALELEGILNHKVDIVTYNAVKNRLFPYIEKELTYV